jgi:hypothetical protein
VIGALPITRSAVELSATFAVANVRERIKRPTR